MSKLFPKAPEVRRPKGFTLVELMVAMALGLILLGIAFTLFDQVNNASDLAGTMADVNQNLRAGVNLVARDLTTCGAGIPLGGIPLPGGSGATLIRRPGPSANTFPNTGFMPVITPGSGLGPARGTIPTDVVTVISVNPLSRLGQQNLVGITFTSTSAQITVAAGTDIAAGASQVVPGQLIMLTNVNSSCLLTATAVDATANTVTFTAGDVYDVLGLNQFPPSATTGTIGQLQTGGTPPTFPSTTANHITMITYYLDDTSPPRRLMRQVGGGTSQPVALGIDVLQLSYDYYDSLGAVTANQRIVPAPNQIRNVNLSVTAKADHPARKSRRYYSNTINTSVVIQNLAYFNKY
jgi:prepilin-type N-terminal cleavage/methylation domain-containing protein